MRLPRIRFTVRGMMAAVAVVAIAIGGYLEFTRYRRVRAEYQRTAAYHARNAASYRKLVALAEQGKTNAQEGAMRGDQEVAQAINDAQNTTDFQRRHYHLKIAAYRTEWRDYWVKYTEYRERQRSGYQKLVDYHTELAEKYALAAGRPWISVALDPPEPKDPLLDGDGDEEPRSPRMRFDF